MNFVIKRSFLLVALISGVLLLAACGNDNNDNETSTTSPTPQEQTAAQPKPVAQIDQLTGKDTKVALDSDFVKALGSLKITPSPQGDAKISKAAVATFPITGGNVIYYKPGTTTPYVQGLINHDGSGLNLQKGDTKVTLDNFNVDPGKSVLTGRVSVNGKVAAPEAPLFFLDGRTLKPLEAKENGTAVLDGTTVKLKKEAADLLNQTFEIKDLQEGMTIGVATITVNVPTTK